MNLVIDEGNTRTKVALFRDEQLIQLHSFSKPLLDIDPHWISELSAKHCIISSVKNPKHIFNSFLNSFDKKIYLDSHTPIPIHNTYESKETLGNDRLAAAVGAWTSYPNTNSMVIDAGTAITYEYISETGEYLGGAISPGINLRFKALSSGTSNLPHIANYKDISIVGKTTEQAIINGVLGGVCYELDARIQAFLNTTKNAIVLGTGGDINFFDKNLKNSIFVLPNLVLIGLNRILRL